jgi:hypothetical protein
MKNEGFGISKYDQTLKSLAYERLRLVKCPGWWLDGFLEIELGT